MEHPLRELIYGLIEHDLEDTYYIRIELSKKKIPKRKLEKLERLAEKELSKTVDSILKEILEETTKYGGTASDAYRLLMWELTGEKIEDFEETEKKLGTKTCEKLATEILTIYKDLSTDWIDSLYQRANLPL